MVVAAVHKHWPCDHWPCKALEPWALPPDAGSDIVLFHVSAFVLLLKLLPMCLQTLDAAVFEFKPKKCVRAHEHACAHMCCICPQVEACVCAYVHACLRAHTHTHMQVCTCCVCVRACGIRMCTRVGLCTRACCVHMCTRIGSCVDTCERSRVFLRTHGSSSHSSTSIAPVFVFLLSFDTFDE